MERRLTVFRRWWGLLALLAIGLVLVGSKLGVRSLATGQAIVPVAGAPVLGPPPTPTATPGSSRVRLRVVVVDQAGQPVPQAIVEVRDRLAAIAGRQETGPTGEAILGIRPGAGYEVTARKPGLALGRVEGIEVAAPAGGPATPDGSRPPATPAGRGQTVQVQVQLGPPEGAGGSRLFVGHTSPRVSTIDPLSNLLLKHSEALGRGRLTLMAVARDMTRVFASWYSASDVVFLNAFDLTVEDRLSLDAGGVTSLVINPTNGHLWVATMAPESPESGLLHEVDVVNREVLRRFPINQTVANIRFRPDGSILYLPNRASNSLGFFDPASGQVVRTTRLPQWPTDLVLSADGSRLYLANLGSSRLLEIDAQTGEQIRAVEVGTGVSAVAAHPDGRHLYIANQTLGYVQVVDLETGQFGDLIPVGRAPQGVALSPDARSLYVANAGSASVSLVDLEANVVRETLATGGSPASVVLLDAPAS